MTSPRAQADVIHRERLFTGICLALVPTGASFALVSNILVQLKQEFILTNFQVGLIGGAALWGMAISLLVFAEWGRLGYVPQYGVDGYVIARAKGQKKKIVEIEGVEVQTRLIESLTDEEARTLFSGTLTALESGLTGEQITGMVNAWQAGDPELLLQIARKYNELVPGAREFEEKFIWSRHERMAAKIEDYLNRTNERHFIAVGSLHLAGPRGLVEILRKRGYIVRQR